MYKPEPILRQSLLDQQRLDTCRQWHQFDYTTKRTPLVTDIWTLLTSYEPEINTTNPAARPMFEKLVEIPGLGILRKACAGDPALSAAVSVMLENFADALEHIPPPPPPGPGDPDDQGEPQPGGQGTPSPDDQEGDQQPGDQPGISQKEEERIKEAVQQAADAFLPKHLVEAARQQSEDMKAAFSLTGDPQPSLRDRMEIANTNFAGLKKILKLAGTLRQTTKETTRNIRATSPDMRLAKPGFGGGMRALALLDPVEIADLTSPGVQETQFWHRWKNRRTRITHSYGKVPADSGPIVLMGDESSSMNSQQAGFTDTDPRLQPADWLQALSLAIAEQCEVDSRQFVYQAWSGAIVRARRFATECNGARVGLTAEQKIRMVSDHAGGGTDLANAVLHGINEAVDLSRGRNVKADVIVVTDGSWMIRDSRLQEVQTKLAGTKVRLHLFLVCQDSEPQNISIWETVHNVGDLLHSTVAVGKILA